MTKQVLIVFITLLSVTSFAQTQFTHVSNRTNNSCNGDCTLLDVPDLNDNPAAIIWVSPIGVSGTDSNRRPIGVYYFKNRWSILNLDQKPVPEGSKFAVEYVTKPDETHFQYVISNEHLQPDGSATIDHPSLNNNPTAQFICFPSWNPEQQRGTTNRELSAVVYSKESGKWIVANVNRKPLFARVTYNIVIRDRGTARRSSSSSNAVGIRELIAAPTSQSPSTPVVGMFMTVETNGVMFSGDNDQSLFADKIRIISFQLGASRPAAALSKIKQVYDPIQIKAQTGMPNTIPFFTAYVKKQTLTLTIETYSTDFNGKTGLNYTIKLSGASIIAYRQLFEDTHLSVLAEKSRKVFDELSVIFTKIEYIKDGVIVEDIL
jgi:hypothetical protein